MQPLSHHEILALIAPFAEQGWHADLAASQRLERSLTFKAREVPGAVEGEVLRVVLRLDNPAAGSCMLTRMSTGPDGLQARLETQGAEPAELLARLQSVPPARQFQRGEGYAIAFNHRVEAGASPKVLLTDAVSQPDGLLVKMKLPRLDKMPAELELHAPAGDVADLPEDLLAVQGASWTRLVRGRGGWVAEVRLRGKGEDRSRNAELRLAQLSQHLVRTLQEPPSAFHDRYTAARWGVAARRGVPLLVCLAVITGALAVPYLKLGPDSVFKMLIFNSPPLLLALFFSLRETPRIEIPPWPRRLKAAAWRSRPVGSPSAEPLPRADAV
jgi:hypothetical protein